MRATLTSGPCLIVRRRPRGWRRRRLPSRWRGSRWPGFGCPSFQKGGCELPSILACVLVVFRTLTFWAPVLVLLAFGFGFQRFIGPNTALSHAQPCTPPTPKKDEIRFHPGLSGVYLGFALGGGWLKCLQVERFQKCNTSASGRCFFCFSVAALQVLAEITKHRCKKQKFGVAANCTKLCHKKQKLGERKS